MRDVYLADIKFLKCNCKCENEVHVKYLEFLENEINRINIELLEREMI